MTARGPDAATSYELRIGGHLDAHWSTWFDGFTLTHEDDGTSTLRGVVRDQSELHGLLAKVRDLGTTLISVGWRTYPNAFARRWRLVRTRWR